MRYIFTIILALSSLIASVAQEKVIRVVETEKYGQLWDKIADEYQSIDSLVVVGPIDKTDFHSMWKCCWDGNLRGIDLSKAKPENDELPEEAFFDEIQNEVNSYEFHYSFNLQLNWITLPQGLKKI